VRSSEREPIAVFPVRRPLLTLAIALVLAVAAALGAWRMRPTASIRAMVGDSSPSADALERALDRFREVDDLFILATISAPDPRGRTDADVLSAFAHDLQAAIRADPEASSLCGRIVAGEDAEIMEYFKSVVIPAGLWYLDDQALDQLLRRLTPPEMRDQLRRDEAMMAAPGPAADALSRVLIQDPLRLREFVAGQIGASRQAGPSFLSPDGSAALIRISGAKPASDLDFCAALTNRIGAITERIRPAGVRVQLAGAYAIAAHTAASIRRDMISNTIWSIVLMQVLFLFSYRRLGAFALAFIPIGLAILLAFGTFSLFKTRITPLTAVCGAVMAGLGIDYCIHYLSHFQAALASSGSDIRAACVKTVREIGLPLLAAGLTSVHGFVAVAFAGVAALRDFALLGALGLAWSMAAAVFFLPAALTLPLSRRAVGAARFDAGVLVRLVTRRGPWWVLAASLGLGLVLLVPLAGPRGWLDLDTDLTVMHPRPSPPLEAQREISRRFSGVADSLLLLIDGDTPDGLAAAAHAATRALSGPEGRSIGYAGSFGLASLVPDPARQGPRAARLALLDPDAMIAAFQDAVLQSRFTPDAFHAYGEFLHVLLSHRKAPDVTVLASYPGLAGLVLPEDASGRAPTSTLTFLFFERNLDDRAERDRVVSGVRSLLAGVPGATLTGVSVVGGDLEAMIRRALPRVLAISAAAVVLTILLAFRRLADVLLALLPAVWSIGSVLAWMALGRERLNMVNMIAFPILLGICVDYGIFMVGLARSSRLAGLGTDRLIERLASSTHAVLMTSGTTVIGFGTLVTCSTPAIQSLGRLVAVGVTGCVVGTLFLLAPLLVITHRPRPAENPGA
jgi:predicted RND superfamily exporter protein